MSADRADALERIAAALERLVELEVARREDELSREAARRRPRPKRAAAAAQPSPEAVRTAATLLRRSGVR